MITCQCNIITEREIEQAIVSMLDEDRWQLIVPLKVYHAMAKRGKCCRCFPNVIDIIIRTTEEYHARCNSNVDDLVVYREKLRRMKAHYLGDFHNPEDHLAA